MAMRPDRTLQPGRIGGYVDLRSYGAIGDGRTVALIALDGSIDWLPLPDLDSRPVFGRLLDAAAGGSIQLAPSEPFTVTRKYVPDTNVLQTTFTTASGVVRLTDALVTGIAGRLPWAELARRVDGIRGTVHLRWRVEPGTMLGTASPWVDDTVYGKVLRVDGVTLTVRGVDHGPRGGGGQALAGAFTTSAGSRHVLAIAGSEGEPAHMPVPELTDVGVDRTVRNWRLWSKEYHYEGPWASAVQRSALALKLLIYSPTGSIAAAATTSLPENHVGDKNWDYRFAWVRDVAYTARALVRFGLREETYASVAWLLRTIRAHDSDVAIFYALDGSLPGEVGALDAPGWKNIGEVVEGNRAKDQLQLGVYGDVLSVLRVYVAAGNVLDIETGRMLARIADRAADAWHRVDSGVWELTELRHNTSSKMGCWEALEKAAQLADLGQIPGDAGRWRAEAARIKEWVDENCWSEDLQSYVAYAGSTDLDASVLLHAPSGFERGQRMSSTIDAIRAHLGRGPLIYRYTGAEKEEGAFVACSFWAASALACVGRHDEASELMNKLIALSNDVGLYSEMIDPETSEFLGNLPQALSHLALINAAITIGELDPKTKTKGNL
jgi:GH15 family glucan-1,4-alpha-glucosidase